MVGSGPSGEWAVSGDGGACPPEACERSHGFGAAALDADRGGRSYGETLLPAQGVSRPFRPARARPAARTCQVLLLPVYRGAADPAEQLLLRLKLAVRLLGRRLHCSALFSPHGDEQRVAALCSCGQPRTFKRPRCALLDSSQISTLGSQRPRCAQVCYSAQVDQMHRETIAEGAAGRGRGSKEQASRAASRQVAPCRFIGFVNAWSPFTCCRTPP